MAAIEVQITASPTIEITHPTVEVTTATDVEIEINSSSLTSVAPGGTHDQAIHDSAGSDIGTVANPSVVADTNVTINGASLGAIGSVVAEGSLDVEVNVNGSPGGSWDGDSWEITYDTVSLAISDTNPDFGGQITLTATANYPVNSYLFFAWRSDTDEFVFLQENGSNTYDWTTEVVGTWSVHVIADNGSSTFAADCVAVTIESDANAEEWLDFVGIPNDSTVYNSGTDQELTGAKYWYAANALIKGIKDDGIWSEGHFLNLLIGGDQDIFKINVFNPSDTDGAFRWEFYGGWGIDHRGATPNGTNTYINSHFNPNTHLASNDGAYMIYKRTKPTGTTTTFEYGATDLASSFENFSSKSTSDRSFFGIGPVVTKIGVSIDDLDGCHIQTRDNNANLIKWFGKDGTLLDSDTTAFNSHPDYDMYIGARNNAGTPFLYLENGQTIGAMGAFDGLSDAQAGNLNTRINTFMTSVKMDV